MPEPESARPTAREAAIRLETGTSPAIRKLPIDAMPADAMQPHSSHTGCPPNWHGPIVVSKSAETHVVIWAKMHSEGERGGRAYPLSTASGM